MGNIRLFNSHSSKDREIAAGVVDLIETALVREDRILCTSHPNKREYGYPNSDRIDVSDHLREHLSESSCVVALLTPYSLDSRWCLFELGGAWARATKTYPLVAGGVTPAHLPAALKGRLFGNSMTNRIFAASSRISVWISGGSRETCHWLRETRVVLASRPTHGGRPLRSISLSALSRRRAGRHPCLQNGIWLIWLVRKVKNGFARASVRGCCQLRVHYSERLSRTCSRGLHICQTCPILVRAGVVEYFPSTFAIQRRKAVGGKPKPFAGTSAAVPDSQGRLKVVNRAVLASCGVSFR
jgi:hypothetical protein